VDAKLPPRSIAAADVALAAAFVAILALPLVDALWHVDPTPPIKENRTSATAPASPDSWAAVRSFPASFEKFWDDHLGFRNLLVRAHGYVSVFAFGVSTTSKVVVGRSHWLFADDEIEYYRHASPYTAEDLEQWRLVLERRTDWLAERGCRYLFVVAPNKSTIYPEMLPVSVRSIHPRSRLDQLVGYLQERSRVSVVDLRPALLAAKGPGVELYHYTDTHWNLRGSFVGYREIAGALSKWFPSIEPLREDEIHLKRDKPIPADLSSMLGVEGALVDPGYRFRTSRPRQWHKVDLPLPAGLLTRPLPDRTFAMENDDPSLPHAVVFRDSFTDSLVAYLSLHFSRVAFFRTTYDFDPESPFEPAIVEQEHPDVVVTEIVERYLKGPAPRMLALPVTPGR
jgi:alginate O-acetyltransferase complex protein AlgJ